MRIFIYPTNKYQVLPTPQAAGRRQGHEGRQPAAPPLTKLAVSGEERGPHGWCGDRRVVVPTRQD